MALFVAGTSDGRSTGERCNGVGGTDEALAHLASLSLQTFVQVQAAGFTIAPLMPQYTHDGESREALLTMVLKADLGGYLAGGCGACRAVLVGRERRPAAIWGGHVLRLFLC